MDYIEKILGMKTQYKSWQHEAELPYYILDRYELYEVTLGTVKTIFLSPKTELEQLAAVKKQIARIQKTENLPVVLFLKSISRTRREYLISSKIPFVVPDKQLYLPFMGIALQEQFQTEYTQTEKFQPSSQVLFFYYLYQKKEQLYIKEAIQALSFSAMTISRAVRQLEQTGLFTTKKNGVQKILIGTYKGRKLFEKAYPHLISPVRKTIYTREQTLPFGSCLSGLSALSIKSMINPPTPACYAIDGKKQIPNGVDLLLDADTQTEIELWRYDPNLLSQNGVVDSLSLVMSLRETIDERIEEAVETILTKVWED